ncbi:MAG TPA: MerR family DNA-binding protein [Steroidobacteraceae bacterium]|jgi:MerR family mercuric resistance operon transcriptional regulator|nr:MerR family DNA-binding protein [Steroidobacteraceae bacterium]
MSRATSQSPSATRARRTGHPVTIGRLARAAEVGVETVRYYQRRHLLAVPPSGGSVRHYPPGMVDRIRFIKRSQSLGFSLDEIRELLRLEEGGNRREIRALAHSRLEHIRHKIGDLQRMERVLSQLVRDCEHATSATRCPIIAALSANMR